MGLLDRILDASIVYSFDRTGYERHSHYFSDAPLQFKPDANAFVTGGTSGIGFEVARQLSRNEMSVVISGRNSEKGEKAAATLNGTEFIQWDLANWDSLAEVVKKLSSLDYLVLNAGGMPENFEKNSYGVESQFASQLFGHYFLLKELKKQNKLKPGAKVVWVSSGGMYLANLKIDKIFKDEQYDKVSTYANVKRAQVTTLQSLKNEFPKCQIMAMHPGWVDTPGVRTSIPKFFEKMKDRLRTGPQGADTILWALSETGPVSSGRLYFDRKQVSPHLLLFTKKSDLQRKKLYQILNYYYEKL